MEQLIIPTSVSSNINENFKEDKEFIKGLFVQAEREMPKFFITLCNDLKKNDKKDWVIRYAHMYLNENYTIEKIKQEMKKARHRRRKSKFGGRRPSGAAKQIRI